MHFITFAQFVLIMMTRLVDPSTVPWGESMPETASAIATACEERPIFGSRDKCAATLVALGKFESSFDPEVCTRYHNPKLCDGGAVAGVFQISKVWKPPSDTLGQARLAAQLADDSDRICHGKPMPLHLVWYARGRNGCPEDAVDAVAKSTHRMRLAASLLKP